MKIYCDSSLKESCVVIEGEEPVILPYQGKVTNNKGEYLAVLAALLQGSRRKRTELEIFTDSLLVVNQVDGLWHCRKEHLLSLRDQVRYLLSLYNAALSWVPRERNLAGKVLEGRWNKKT